MGRLIRRSNGILRSALQLRFLSDQTPKAPSKETLLTTDWGLAGLMPNFFKSNMGGLFQRMTPDVEFEDRVFGYKLRGTSALNVHLLKVRTYFRYKSPYNKLEYLGSSIYEGDEVLTILWRLQSLKSSFIRYFPAFISGRQQEYHKWEGALDVHVQPEGKIYKMVNRPATDADREAAARFAKIKQKSMENAERKEAEIADGAAKKIHDETP